MRKIAIVSDIHSNLTAFDAVLEDISKQNVDSIYCLGDVIGYGPDPVVCFRKAVESCQVIIKGNHEDGVVNGAFGVTEVAKRAMMWTRKQMNPLFYSFPHKKKIWQFLSDLPESHIEDRLLFVHGAPSCPVFEYLQADDTKDIFGDVPRKIAENFDLIEHLCFVGHTHQPGIITERSEWFSPQDFDYEWEIRKEEKIICNVGSVGQPRDGDIRSSYVIFDGNKICYRRIPYDIEATQEKIRAIQDLDNRLANRLVYGR